MTTTAATAPPPPPSRIGARPVRATGPSDFTELATRIRESGLLRRRYGYYWT